MVRPGCGSPSSFLQQILGMGNYHGSKQRREEKIFSCQEEVKLNGIIGM
jgi:hypothetical protein